jgi:hypothetical protein
MNLHGQTTIPTGLSDVIEIAAGGHHSLALKGDGTLVAWGCGFPADYGQCSPPTGLDEVIAIAADGAHSLALESDGTVTAWGLNNCGQSTVPVGLSGVTAIAAGTYHSLAIQASIPEAFQKTSPEDGASALGLDPTLSWGTSVGALTYEYCLDTSPNEQCDASWTSAGTDTSLPLSGLSAETTYSWQVRAVNPGGSTEADGGDWWSFSTAPACPAWDLNCDGVLDILDISYFGAFWNQSGPPGWTPADVNRDGTIDVGDVSILGAHWNESW